MLAALTNAIVVRNEHDVELDAWTQSVTDDWIGNMAVDAEPYTGIGGVREITLDQGR